MAKRKENTEYLKLASEIVESMKERIQNELDMNVALSETQKNVLNYIRKNTKPNTQNIEFKSLQEFENFKNSFVDTKLEKTDQSTVRLKQVLDNLTPENMDKTKNELNKIRQSINTEKEFAQKRLDLASEIANTMVEFIKNNNSNDGNLRAIGAQVAFLDKSKGFLNREGKITLLNNQDFNKFKGHIDTFTQSVNSPEIHEKIENLVSDMGDLSTGNIVTVQENLEAFRKKNNLKAELTSDEALKKSQKVGKKIKRAFKSARAKVSSIGSTVSNKVTEFKESAQARGREWKDKVKNQINTWRGR